MSLWRQFSRGLRTLTNRKASDQAIDDEIEHYLEESTAAFAAKGLPPEEARRAARLELGASLSAREEVRAYGWENRIDNLWADLRYAGRTLTGNPGFTAVSILTLALGIGASTAIFSVVDAVLLRSLPYPEPQQIVRIWEQAPNGHRINLADANFGDFLTQNHTFASVAAYNERQASVSGGSEPVRVKWSEVSSGFFDTLGIKPLRGRTFSPEESQTQGIPTVIVSFHFWQRYFGGAEDLSPLHLKIEGKDYAVVGVMPERFDYPAGYSLWTPVELQLQSQHRTGHNWRGIGRIKTGIPLAQARQDLSGIARRIRAEYGKKVDLQDAAVLPLDKALVGDVQTALLTLLGAVGLLLLVACANVAGLLVARGAARRKELALRVALGAGRGRLLQQFLVESLALSLAGGTLGVLLAAWAVRLLPAILPANLPRQQGIEMNTGVLLFALTATFAVGAALGALAAWRAGRGDVQQSLASGSRAYTGTGPSQRLRGVVVTGEIAATLVILIAAGLLGRSFLRLVSTSPGFQARNLVTMQFSVPVETEQNGALGPDGVARQARLLERVSARLQALPGVEAVGVSGAMPVAEGDNLAEGDFLILNGRKPPADFEEFQRMGQNSGQTGHALYAVAGEEYFRTMGIQLVRGRMFAAQDQAEAQHVAVISEALARQRWPGQDPLGQVLEFGNMDGNLKPLTVVGVVGDVRARGLDAPPGSVIYVNYRQRGMNLNSTPTLLLRTAVPVKEVVQQARVIVQEMAPDVPLKFSTFEEQMSGWLADRRFLLLLVGLFAAAALSLAAIGIYGVVAFSVARRTQEIGIRVAMGARRGDILRLVVGEGARLAVLGAAIGIAASLLITRLLTTLLFGISNTDPVTYAGVALLLGLVAVLASYLPARRAMRLDPNTALRYE